MKARSHGAAKAPVVDRRYALSAPAGSAAAAASPPSLLSSASAAPAGDWRGRKVSAAPASAALASASSGAAPRYRGPPSSPDPDGKFVENFLQHAVSAFSLDTPVPPQPTASPPQRGGPPQIALRLPQGRTAQALMPFVQRQREICMEQVRRWVAEAFAPGHDCPDWARGAPPPQWNLSAINAGVCSLAELYEQLADLALRSNTDALLALHAFLVDEEEACASLASLWQETTYLRIVTDTLDSASDRTQQALDFHARLDDAQVALPAAMRASMREFSRQLSACRKQAVAAANALRHQPGQRVFDAQSDAGMPMRKIMRTLIEGYNMAFKQAHIAANRLARLDYTVVQAADLYLQSEIHKVQSLVGLLAPLSPVLVINLQCLRDDLRAWPAAVAAGKAREGKGVAAGHGGGGGGGGGVRSAGPAVLDAAGKSQVAMHPSNPARAGQAYE